MLRLELQMRPSLVLRLPAIKLTLFTRANCGLCETAKVSISQVQKRHAVEFSEIDIMASGQQKWRDVYDFDVPVLHVDQVTGERDSPTLDTARKLMHRFTAEEVESAMEEVEQQST